MDLREPVWLVVVLRGNGEGVEEHEEDHQPVEDVGLDGGAALPPAEPIPAAPVATWKIGEGKSSCQKRIFRLLQLSAKGDFSLPLDLDLVLIYCSRVAGSSSSSP